MVQFNLFSTASNLNETMILLMGQSPSSKSSANECKPASGHEMSNQAFLPELRIGLNDSSNNTSANVQQMKQIASHKVRTCCPRTNHGQLYPCLAPIHCK